MSNQLLPAEGFARQSTVLKVLGISESTLRRGIKQGIYPKPVQISSNIVGWRVEDIRELIAKIGAQVEE